MTLTTKPNGSTSKADQPCGDDKLDLSKPGHEARVLIQLDPIFKKESGKSNQIFGCACIQYQLALHIAPFDPII